MTSGTQRCVLAVALSTLAASHADPLDLHAVEADDECDAGDGRCALSALQTRAMMQKATVESGCHDALPGEACYSEMMWAKTDGLVNHPEWYAPAGVTLNSSDPELQNFVHDSHPQTCPRPCSVEKKRPWCSQGAVAPKLWAPAQTAGSIQIKVLSYNLFWWNLFGIKHGNNNSAGKLIQEFNEPQAFDVIGFQECEDPTKVLNPLGLDTTFEAFQGAHAICMAYNKKTWTLLANGTAEVSEDMPTRYYGRRGTQWMRLQNRQTDQTLFFVNHHGPLSVNSGGRCGGEATAYNILQVMAKNAEVGDVLVLVGDFNANAASLTIQTMWSNLVQSFAGDSFGGVDNVFSNVASIDVVETKIMGSGGSDHNAIYAVLQVGQPSELKPTMDAGTKVPLTSASVTAAEALVGDAKPGYEWQHFWCGQIEDSTSYVFEGSFWNRSVTGEAALDPEHCCRECQAVGDDCKSWVWKDYSAQANGKECLMNGNPSPAKKAVDGFVSGLTYTASFAHAEKSAASARRSMDDMTVQALGTSSDLR